MTDSPQSLGYRVRLHSVIDETADAKSLVFDIPADLEPAFTYKPGQFLTLRIPSEQTGSVARCYSLASSPFVDARPKVTVKRTAAGYGSNWLCDNAVPGLVLQVLPPSGTFTPTSLDGDFLLCAAGSGVTPVLSILESVLDRGTGEVALFYANRDADSIIFDERLERLAKSHPDRVTIEHWLESERGLPTADALTAFAQRFGEREAFLCGPAPFMAAAQRALAAAGFDRHRVHLEEFVSLHGDPFAPIGALDPAASDVSTVEVLLDGQRHVLDWPANANLIDVLVNAGIDAPFSCREGECGSCMCTLRKGDVDVGTVDALDPDDVADGYILACQATPRSPFLEIEF